MLPHRVADAIKDANQLNVRWGDCPKLSRWAKCNNMDPEKVKKEEAKSEWDVKRTQLPLLALKMEEAATNQKM